MATVYVWCPYGLTFEEWRATNAPTNVTNATTLSSSSDISDYITFGHASLQLKNGTYISWGPQDFSLKMFVQGVPGKKMRSYEMDLGEENKAAELVTELPDILNEEKITKWWTSFKGLYDLTHDNCSTVVYKALREGSSNSYVDSKTRAWAEGTGIWVPYAIDTYAKAIQSWWY